MNYCMTDRTGGTDGELPPIYISLLLKTSYYTLCEMILKQKGNLNQITVVSLRSTTKRLITGILQMILQKRDHFKLI